MHVKGYLPKPSISLQHSCEISVFEDFGHLLQSTTSVFKIVQTLNLDHL